MTVEATLTINSMRSSDAFRQLKDVWQTLERMDTDCMPANTWQWANLWWQHYSGPNDKLVLLVARLENEIVAIAPLYIDSGRMCRVVPVRVLRFIGSGRDTSPDYLNIIAIPKCRQAAERAFMDHIGKLRGWQKLYLSDMREDSSLPCTAREFVRQQPGVLVPERQRRLLRAELPDSWDRYRATLSRKRRKQINHRQNRLDAAGTHELSLCSTREDVIKATDALIELHRRRWQSKGVRGAFQSESYEQFHRALIADFFASDMLWLATLTCDGQIIGVLYLYAWRGELQFFQSGYSPDHISLSPGHVLFTYVIKRGIEQGMETIDLLKGDYEYKSAYAKNHVTTCDIGLIRPGFRSMLDVTMRVGIKGWRLVSQPKTDLQ